jgi:hypothetical protein
MRQFLQFGLRLRIHHIFAARGEPARHGGAAFARQLLDSQTQHGGDSSDGALAWLLVNIGQYATGLCSGGAQESRLIFGDSEGHGHATELK